MIKAVIFDCFGVLYVDPTGYFYNIAARHNRRDQAEQFSDLIKQVDRGIISQDEFFDRVGTLFSVTAKEVSEHLLKGVARNDELLNFMVQLHQHYKTGLLSNINHAMMDNFFSEEERRTLFDSVVLSSDVGSIKPHSEIFQYALKQLAVKPPEAIFIDDNEANCVGAIAVGMHAIHHVTNYQTQEELQRLLAVTGR